MNKFITIVFVSMFFLIGCQSLEGFHKTTNFLERGNPEVIITRNSSNQDFEKVSITGTDIDRGRRLPRGSVSPVNRGVSQIYRRGDSDMAPLADEMRVILLTKDGIEHHRNVDIRAALVALYKEPTKSLIFDIQKDLSVIAYIE